MQKTWIRIVVDIAMGIAVLTLPWYVSAVLLVALILYFPLYIEGLLFAFLFDTLYARQLTFPYVALLLATIFVAIVYFVRTCIRT